jgi:outer membrane protein OmpA-like peptidoglycan-associated protein
MSALIAVLSLLSPLDPPPAAGTQAARWLGCSAFETPRGTVIVDRIAYAFFDPDSSTITAQAAAQLDSFVSGHDTPAGCEVTVQAHADRTGPADHNLRLSRRRGEAVAAYLRRKGLTLPIVIEALGETRPLVETPDGVAEAQNRGVIVWVKDGLPRNSETVSARPR